jgi:hypothetical protein
LAVRLRDEALRDLVVLPAEVFRAVLRIAISFGSCGY